MPAGITASMSRCKLVAIVAKKYQEKPFFKWILGKFGTMVWMDRDAADFGALREALDYLRQGVVVGIAPEGVPLLYRTSSLRSLSR